MSRFRKLFFRETPSSLPGQTFADDRSELLTQLVAESNSLKLWLPDRPIPLKGTFLLVGVATWSGYDMMLLDAIEAAVVHPDVVGVFDMQEMQSPDFSARIPGLVDVMQGPVAGLWQDGRLVAAGSGHDAREIAFTACKLDPSEIPERLDVFAGRPMPDLG